MLEFIVAEVSKNWEGRKYPVGQMNPIAAADCLGGRFERIIEFNRQRGYLLHSFHVSQVMIGPDEMTETIIAAFQKAKEPNPKLPRAAAEPA
jgi:hypothetical protein